MSNILTGNEIQYMCCGCVVWECCEFYRYDVSIRPLMSALLSLDSMCTLHAACRVETDSQRRILSHDVFSQSAVMTPKFQCFSRQALDWTDEQPITRDDNHFPLMAYAPVMPACLSNELQFSSHQGKVNISGISSRGTFDE